MKSSIYMLCFVCLIFCVANVHASHDRTIESIIQPFEQKYSVNIIYSDIPSPTWNEMSYDECSSQEYFMVAGYMEMLVEEFRKYPPDFIKRSKLKKIAVVKSLAFSGQFRSAVPDYCKEVLYFDYLNGQHNETYQRHVMHHEYFHMIEEEFNGDPYYKDPQWNALNTDGFQYGNGGTANQVTGMYMLIHPQSGFVNRYSMTGLEEDKAELSAVLFTEDEAQLIYSWAQEDEILNNKIEYMKRFYRSKSDNMDNEYWENLFSDDPQNYDDNDTSDDNSYDNDQSDTPSDNTQPDTPPSDNNPDTSNDNDDNGSQSIFDIIIDFFGSIF